MNIDEYQIEIQKLHKMHKVCVALLEFENDSIHRKHKLNVLAEEIIKKGNNNRYKTISKIIQKAKDDTVISSSKRDELIKNITGFNPISDEIHKYVIELAVSGPKTYMFECLDKIKDYQEKIKQERLREVVREDPKKALRSMKEKTTHTYIEDTPTKTNKVYASPKEELTLKEIIKKHLKDNNPYINNNEIEAIKKEFRIEFFKDEPGYLSNDTIKKLFMIRIVNEQMDRHEKVNIRGIVESMDAIYDLALIEMSYDKMNSKYERVLNNINYVRDRDYVEEYAKLYAKVQEASSEFSDVDRETLRTYIKESKLMRDQTVLPTPDEFRQYVNDAAKRRVDWAAAANRRSAVPTDSITRYTRYMKPEELAVYYHTLQFNLNDYDKAGLQSLFVNIIERRMDPIGLDVDNEKRKTETQRRYKAISHEYLNEEPIMFDTRGVIAHPNYAKSNIELKEANKRANIGKIYFRDGKTKRAIVFMNFKKLKEKADLKKLTEKGVLTEDEIAIVRSMF